MKTLLTLAIICLSASTLFAKKGPDNNIQKPNYYVSKDTIYLVTNDTLKLSISQKYDSCSTPDWHRDMPWIGAVLLGIMTIIANLIISRQTRISNSVLTPQIAGHNLINKLGLIKFGNYDKNTTKFYT
jgi:hypothetical protein